MRRTGPPPERWDVAMLAGAEAIRQLKARYFRYVDTKRWQALRGLFTEDATLHFAQRMAEPEPCDVAIARIADMLKPDVVSVHHGSLGEIDMIDDMHASALWTMRDILVFPADRPNPLGVLRLEGHGHYHERYVRGADGWRIATLRLDRLLVEEYPMVQEA